MNTGSGFILLNGVQRVTFDLINSTESKEECGNRYPTYLVEGTYGTSGTLERFYTGSGTTGMFYSGQASLPMVELQIYPAGSGSGRSFIALGNVKMDKLSVSQRPSSNIMTENWSFVGTGSFDTRTV